MNKDAEKEMPVEKGMEIVGPEIVEPEIVEPEIVGPEIVGHVGIVTMVTETVVNSSREIVKWCFWGLAR